MFDWFLGSSATGGPGLETMRAEFGQMLDAGRRLFDTATNALLGGTDLEVIRDGLYETDRRINRAEQQIRRQIIVHASVHGVTEFPSCLVLMSVVKDAERVGDYAKNIFELAELLPHPPGGQHREQLIKLKERISQMMATCREIYDAHSKEHASELIHEAHEIQTFCEDQVRQLVCEEEPIDLAAAYVLAYRYFKRVSAHTSNIASSIVEPLDKLDFPAKPEGEESEAGE
ncbi:hypothetical protein LCGC14_2571400 [marine sediment metagenome]|uniref:PhoU domain-containing protein n=1 Tax=marine sediment metagenome TaxID=412755 RepID=A0A0F9AH43_9ZZZZ